MVKFLLFWGMSMPFLLLGLLLISIVSVVGYVAVLDRLNSIERILQQQLTLMYRDAILSVAIPLVISPAPTMLIGLAVMAVDDDDFGLRNLFGDENDV